MRVPVVRGRGERSRQTARNVCDSQQHGSETAKRIVKCVDVYAFLRSADIHLFAGASFHVNRFGLTTACLRVVAGSWSACWRSYRWLRSQLKQLIVDADRFIHSVFETMWDSPPHLSHNIPRRMARLLYEVRPGSATCPQYSIDSICYDLVCDALEKNTLVEFHSTSDLVSLGEVLVTHANSFRWSQR